MKKPKKHVHRWEPTGLATHRVSDIINESSGMWFVEFASGWMCDGCESWMSPSAFTHYVNQLERNKRKVKK